MENELAHIDLFSGIGGFALAAGWAGFRTACFCEIDEFCQEVLKERFGAIAESCKSRLEKRKGESSNDGTKCASIKRGPILIPDIRDFDGTRWRGATLLTGGFPCQPFSHAGKRRGKEDDRHLWPEMLRVISEARPAWVLGENVAGIINMELEQVCADLEGEDYEVQPVVIPAVAVNAPHRRMRVWIVANSEGERLQRRGDGGKGFDPKAMRLLSARPDSDAPDTSPTDVLGWGGRGNTNLNWMETSKQPGCGSWGEYTRCFENSWDIPWLEVATSLCRVDDGLPAWIHSRRVQRLKALGNAVVPQIPHEIIKGIAEIERR